MPREKTVQKGWAQKRKIYNQRPVGYMGLAFNARVAPFDDRRVRLAFAHLFNREKPGKHQVWVCHTLPCALRGGESLVKHCEKKLGVQVGQTTEDGKVTLRTAECLASCGTGPMIQVDKTYHENLTTQDVDRILDGLLAD